MSLNSKVYLFLSNSIPLPGKAIHKKVKEKVIAFSDIFITSKVANTLQDNVRECCETSLASLGVPYIHLYLLQSPCAVKVSPRALRNIAFLTRNPLNSSLPPPKPLRSQSESEIAAKQESYLPIFKTSL